MTKEHAKRRIEIEDKRLREEKHKQAASGADGAAPPAPVVGAAPTGRPVVAQGRDSYPEPTGKMPAPPESAAPAPPDWQALAAEYLNLAQRKEADLRNYKKRVAQDMEDARRFAVEGLLADLFPALDGLAQCAHTYRERPDGEDPLLDGVRRTVRALESALSKHGVTKINAAGVPFDPALHQALTIEESADITEETVAEVYVEGYRIGDIVLKPAMVRVLRPGDA